MKKTWLAGLLSFLFPGMGQFYLGRMVLGILFAAGYTPTIFMAFSSENFIVAFGVLISFLVWISSISHAVISSKK